MDIFEYGVATVSCEEVKPSHVQLIFAFSTNSIDAKGSVKPEKTSEKIEGAVFERVRYVIWERENDPEYRNQFGDAMPVNRSYVGISANELTLAVSPYLTKLGAEGWEVIEYKFSTDPAVFAQALLKRKAQK